MIRALKLIAQALAVWLVCAASFYALYHLFHLSSTHVSDYHLGMERQVQMQQQWRRAHPDVPLFTCAACIVNMGTRRSSFTCDSCNSTLCSTDLPEQQRSLLRSNLVDEYLREAWLLDLAPASHALFHSLFDFVLTCPAFHLHPVAVLCVVLAGALAYACARYFCWLVPMIREEKYKADFARHQLELKRKMQELETSTAPVCPQ